MIGGVLRYPQGVESYHARDDDEASNGKDHHEDNLLPLGNLDLIYYSHGQDVYECTLENVQSSVCEEESIDVDARSRDSPGHVPGFMNGGALEYTGRQRSSGSNDDKG